MATFSDLDFQAHSSHPGGKQAKVFFSNGYGASVIMSPYSYGGESGFYEMAVLRGSERDFSLCYDTPITDDVIGWMSEDQVSEALQQIETLPAVEAA